MYFVYFELWDTCNFSEGMNAVSTYLPTFTVNKVTDFVTCVV